MLSLLFAGSTLTLFGQEQADEGIKFMVNEPWEQVLQQAKEQNRLVFMDCYTVWCGPCKGLAQNIFPRKDVGDFFNANFVNAQYDLEKGDGKMLYDKYRENIIGFPTLLLIDANGQVVHQMAGYQEAPALIAGMKAGLEGNSLFAAQARYESGARDLETVRAYVNALTGAFQNEKIPAIVQEFVSTIPVDRLLEPEVWQLVGKYIKDPYGEPYNFVLQNIWRGYQIRLKVDRYALESQLLSGMKSAVEEIVKTSRATRDADTLQQLADRAAYLEGLLAKHAIKGFPTYLAQLKINALVLAGDTGECYRLLAHARELGLLQTETNFTAAAYRYIIENVKDKNLIRACIGGIEEIQARQPEKIEFAFNYYDILALAHQKLKEHDAANRATAEFERRDAAKKAYAKTFFQKKEPAAEAQ
jgi:thiol-disulfide isomerase/thioredoxin